MSSKFAKDRQVFKGSNFENNLADPIEIIFCFSGGLLRELSGFSKKDGKIDGEIEFNGKTNGVECTKPTKIVD